LSQELPPVFVLGLKKNFRGKKLLSQLDELGLKYKIVWGLEIENMESRYLDSYLDHSRSKYLLRRQMSLEELSCALGHLEMYEDFLLTNAEWGLFFEDDARISLSSTKLFKDLPNFIPPAVITLANSLDARFEPNPFPFLRSELTLGERYLFRECAMAPVLAHAYLMNKGGAFRATHLMRGQKVYTPADFPFQFRSSLKFYASSCNIVEIEKLKSTIDNGRLTEQHKIKYGSILGNFVRRFRVAFDYSGLGVLYAKRLGISPRSYFKERVVLHWKYKRFTQGHSSEFFR